MGFGSLGKWIKRAVRGDDGGDEPRVYGRGHPHKYAAPSTGHGMPTRASVDADAEVIRAYVPVDETSALEQLYENQADTVLVDADDRDGGVQGEAHWDTARCDDDADIADDFFVAVPGGRFERARSSSLPNRPRL